jgi:hypothetical protein
MSDAAAPVIEAPDGPNDEYRALVRDAYISPIRSVIAVDDDFPTLDGALTSVLSERGSWTAKKEAAQLVLEILGFCRTRKTPWLVDIHDGANAALDSLPVPHLHQSDLVLLDYHLDGQEGGDQAVALLRRLAKNDNFNLVVVYTKGVGGGIGQIFWEIVAGLTFAEWEPSLPERLEAVGALIGQWEDHDDQLVSKLLNVVSNEVYLKERMRPGSSRGDIYRTIEAIARGAPEGTAIRTDQLIEWTYRERHKKLFTELSAVNLGGVNGEFSDDVNWIRMDQLFVTVIEKRKRPEELEAVLLDALVKYSPSPHQLLMARMRADMDEKGADAESEIMGDVYLQAGWLSELVDGDQPNRKRLLRATLDRHWEALGYRLRPEIDGYADRLIGNILTRGKEKVFQEFVDPSVGADKVKIAAHLNNFYNCSKTVGGAHLTTGHILEFADPAPALTYWVPRRTTYWVCLTPACDLVPGQKESQSSWHGRLGGFMPFAAVKLEAVNTTTAVQKATTSDFVFFSIGDNVEAFKFSPSAREEMFASNQGKFIDEQSTVGVSRLSGVDGNLVLSSIEPVRIVAQLRYEYALNLLQRLGSTLSRVGLDFTAPK